MEKKWNGTNNTWILLLFSKRENWTKCEYFGPILDKSVWDWLLWSINNWKLPQLGKKIYKHFWTICKVVCAWYKRQFYIILFYKFHIAMVRCKVESWKEGLIVLILIKTPKRLFLTITDITIQGAEIRHISISEKETRRSINKQQTVFSAN